MKGECPKHTAMKRSEEKRRKLSMHDNKRDRGLAKHICFHFPFSYHISHTHSVQSDRRPIPKAQFQNKRVKPLKNSEGAQRRRRNERLEYTGPPVARPREECRHSFFFFFLFFSFSFFIAHFLSPFPTVPVFCAFLVLLPLFLVVKTPHSSPPFWAVLLCIRVAFPFSCSCWKS